MNGHQENLHGGTPDMQAATPIAPKKRAKAKAPKRTCIMVLGMHRSGTSALTRTISLLGAELPKKLISKDNNNPTGYWEPAALNALNDRMLAEAGSRWDDWRAFDMADLAKSRAQFYRAEIASILEEEYGDARLFVLKEPRISRFAPFYAAILKSMKINVCYVLTGRNPLSVIASLGRRDGFTSGFGALLWLRHELEAERATRGKPRVFLSYEAIMQNWRSEIEKMTATLAINWLHTVDDVAVQVDAYLSREHQHHAAGDAQLLADERIGDWVKDAYAAFTALRKDGQDVEALATLDRVKAEFDSVSPIFGDAIFPEFEARRQASTRLGQERATEIARLAAEAQKRSSECADREAKLTRERSELERLAEERAGKNEELERESAALRAHATKLEKERAQARLQEQRLRDALAAVYHSTSWRISAPVRAVKYSAQTIARLPSAGRAFIARRAYIAWHGLSMSPDAKHKLKSTIFRTLPFLFRGTTAYRAWQDFDALRRQLEFAPPTSSTQAAA
jgi:hypothetical protein